MTRLRSLILFSFMVSILSLIYACGGNQGQQKGHDHEAMSHGEGQAYSTTYVCTMHCDGSGGESAGKCPVCGMDYVLLTEHVQDGHKHE